MFTSQINLKEIFFIDFERSRKDDKKLKGTKRNNDKDGEQEIEEANQLRAKLGLAPLER